MFVKYKVHRVYVLDAMNEPYGVVSLGDFLDELLHDDTVLRDADLPSVQLKE
jgi:hypothetical protein